MADNDSAQEKTEEPTPKRLQKAKDDGQAPRSRELTTTAVLLAGTVGLYVFGGWLATDLLDVMRLNFSVERETLLDTNLMVAQLAASFKIALLGLIPLFSVLFLAALIGPIALGGWIFSTKSLAPKMDRISPLAGLKRMFSMKSLVELFKSIAKVVFVGAAAFSLAKYFQSELLGLSSEPLWSAVLHALDLSLKTAIILSLVTIAIAAIDVPFQIHDHVKKLRMSTQDIKDEMKDSEGKPEVKSRIRQLQMEMAQNRMMDSVPDADVVITNPTHFSVAIKYDPNTMGTPVVVAKGVDQAAFRIREVAKKNQVELLEAPPLARAIYHSTRINDEVPEGLFVAVAQVLAYVFQLRDYKKGRGQRPVQPRRFDIPDDMAR